MESFLVFFLKKKSLYFNLIWIIVQLGKELQIIYLELGGYFVADEKSTCPPVNTHSGPF